MIATAAKSGQGTVLYDVPWEVYEGILKALGDRRFPHTYQDGTLEIFMSPSEDHEQIAGFLGRMIETMSVELDIPIDTVGSATRRKKRLAHGLEPDESYYVHPNRRKAKNGGSTQVPDLAIEVDLRRTRLKRLLSYAKLGIREVWRYRKGGVELFALNSSGSYESIERSNVFPLLTTQIVTRFVAEMRESGEHEAILGFIRWVRKHRRKN